MGQRSKRAVWLLLKLVELFLSLGCCIKHNQCSKKADVPHIFLLFGTYGGSVIILTMSLIGVFYAERPIIKHEAATAGLLGFLHILTVFAQMNITTLDIFQTSQWPTLYECYRDNALISLYAAAVYLLHCTFALDLMYSRDQAKTDPMGNNRPLRLYFITPETEVFMNRFAWFRVISAQNVKSS
ncbi:hypothetical protein KR018_007390, partial [Drosophila ironensis]